MPEKLRFYIHPDPWKAILKLDTRYTICRRLLLFREYLGDPFSIPIGELSRVDLMPGGFLPGDEAEFCSSGWIGGAQAEPVRLMEQLAAQLTDKRDRLRSRLS